MSDDSIPDIEIMINRLIDGELSPSEAAALDRRLLRDPEAHAMLRDYRAMDDECRDVIGAALAPTPVADSSEPNRTWGVAVLALAAAAAVVVGVVLWSAFAPPPQAPRPILAGDIVDQSPTTARSAELAIDRFDPTPVRHIMTNPVRRVDRIPVGLYDAESRQMRIILVDREQEQPEPQWQDL